MKTRISGPLALAFLAVAMALPALADCCSGVLSCAAAVYTGGVSCEIQTIIDTIIALQTEVTHPPSPAQIDACPIDIRPR